MQLYGRDLVGRETRLAKIFPGQWKDRIQCYLILHDIDQVPRTPYKALSYVWGSSKAVEVINLNDHNHNVTVNLACAIRHIRNTERPIWIWIDALCINQVDIYEKGHQVALMRDIYAGAEEVLVFLGDGNDHRISRSYFAQPPEPPVVFWNDARDVSLLRRFHESLPSIRIHKSQNAFYAICLVRSLSHERGIKSVIEGTQARVRQEIFELLRRLATEPWWQRIWVVQEIAIPARATIRYGNVTAPWDMFVRAAQARYYFLNVEAEQNKVISVFIRQVLDIEDLRSKRRKSNGTNFLSLLQRFSYRKATNDYDKVYALLGLASEKDLLNPDYSVSIQELYMRTVIALIRAHRSLAPLSGNLKRKNSQSQGLASWIPDWGAIFNESDSKRMVLQSVYNACSDWRIAVFQTVDEYWANVAEQIGLLVKDLQKSATRPRQITVQLRAALIDYMQCLTGYKDSPRRIRSSAHINAICKSCSLLLELTKGGKHDAPAATIIETKELFKLSAIFRGYSARIPTLRLGGTETLHEIFDGGDDHDSFVRWLVESEPQGGFILSSINWDERTLLIESRFLAKVLWCGTKLTSWMDVNSSLLTVSTWARKALYPQPFTQPSTQLRTRFIRTLAGGICYRAGRLDRIRLGDHSRLFQWFESSLLPQLRQICPISEKAILDSYILMDPGDSVTTHMVTPQHLFTQHRGLNAQGFDNMMRLVTEGRVFFQTEEGHMGLGPASMAPEDEIHVLPGGQTHFVLRRRGSETDAFELVGDCFLDQDLSELDREERLIEDCFPDQDPSELDRLNGSLPREVLGLFCIKHGIQFGDGSRKIRLN
ncbi:heterokaryon incompatibility protein-domain-containing protein [Xylaria scruposa]|nr:heterokaryon incompatibility protein-domain-containing protein [Xylaria scruposa]